MSNSKEFYQAKLVLHDLRSPRKCDVKHGKLLKLVYGLLCLVLDYFEFLELRLQVLKEVRCVENIDHAFQSVVKP